MKNSKELELQIVNNLKKGLGLTSSEVQYLIALIRRIASLKLYMYFRGYGNLDDLIQDAYLKFHLKIREGKYTYNQSKGIGAYLSKILENLINSEKRGYKKLSFREYLPERTYEDTEPVYTMEELKDIARTILSEREQEIILMSFEKGFDNEVIAERLGYSNKSTLGNMKYRSIEKLRVVLQKSAA